MVEGDYITGINYYSKKELLLKKKLMTEEIKSRNPCLQKDIDYTWLSFRNVKKGFLWN